MDKWHYVLDGNQAGPADAIELAMLLRQGKVTPSTLVWKAGLPTWETLSEALPHLTETADDVPEVKQPPAKVGITSSQRRRAEAARETFTRKPQPQSSPQSLPQQSQPLPAREEPPAAPSRGPRVLLGIVAVLFVLVVIWVFLPRSAQKNDGKQSEARPSPSATTAPALASPTAPPAAIDEAAISRSGVTREVLPPRVMDFVLDPSTVRLAEVNDLKILRAIYRSGDAAVSLQFLKVKSQIEGEETAYAAAKSAGVEEPVPTGENPKVFKVLGKNQSQFAAWTVSNTVFTLVSPNPETEKRFLDAYLGDTLSVLPPGTGLP